MSPKPDSTNEVITKEESEVRELASEFSEFIIENYGEYPTHVLFASLMIVTNSLFKAMEENRRNKQNENSN